MMRAVISLLALCIFAGALAVTSSGARADVSDALGNVLEQVRFMGSSDFAGLQKWANSGAPMPPTPVFQPEKAEVDILNLSSGDQNAVLSWLQGHGRAALYAQGATDSQIGPRRDMDTAAPATPNPWRSIPLASASLDATTVGQIQILGGWAAVKNDGTSALACVSFKNVDPRVAKHVVIEFPLLNKDGDVLGTLTLDRNGEFSPNVDIRTFDNQKSWQSGGVGPTKSFLDNCIRRDLPTAALPLLQARTAGYHITRVDYADGSSWPTPAAH